MQEAKSHLSRLVRHAEQGEEVILTRGPKRVPVVKLVALGSPLPMGEAAPNASLKKGKRPIGLYKGKFKIGPEFFDPLPEEELLRWEGESSGQESQGSL